MFFFSFVIMAFFADRIGAFSVFGSLRILATKESRFAVPLFIPVVLLVVAFALQLQLFSEIHVYLMHETHWTHALPLLNDSAIPQITIKSGLLFPLAVLIAAQSVCLFLIARRTTSAMLTKVDIVTIMAAAACMGFLAFHISLFTSGDAFCYIGYSLLGVKAYNPPAQSFGGEFAVINQFWGTPLPGEVYGPAWQALSGCALSPFTTLGGKLFALRSIEAGALLGIVLLLRRISFAPAVWVLVALNPVIYLEYLGNGHLDLLGVFFLVLALVLSSRSVIASAIAVIIAGLIKLPLFLPGLLAFRSVERLSKRLAWSAAVVATIFVISFAFGGVSYFSAIMVQAHHFGYHSNVQLLQNVPHFITLIIALTSIAAGVVFLRSLKVSILGQTALGAAYFSWYLIWCLPCALLEDEIAVRYLIALPILDFGLSAYFNSNYLWLALTAAALVLIVVNLLDRMKTPQPLTVSGR